VRQEHATNTRLRLFGKLAGMLDPDDYHDSRVNMMMEGLRALFHTNEIHGHMEGHPSIAVTSLASATLAVFTSKYYFPDDDELLLVEGKPMLHPDMEEEIRELADPEDKPEQVNIDVWMEWLFEEYLESRENAEEYFATQYHKYDINKDGTMDLTEFTTLIHDIDKSKDQNVLMEMFNLALDCTDHGDTISKEAFSYVAMQYHLPHPAHKHNPDHQPHHHHHHHHRTESSHHDALSRASGVQGKH